MKTTRRIFSLTLSVMLIVSALVGCGGASAPVAPASGNSASSPAPASLPASVLAPTEGKTVVEFWHSQGGNNGKLIEQMALDFNATHPNIEVVPTFQGGDYWIAASKAQAAVSAGENPDILMMGADHVSIFAQEEGLLADLKPYMAKSGIDDKDFVEAFSWDYRIGDSMIAIPFGRSTPILYVNNDILKAAGQKIPTSWEELESVSDAIVKGGHAEYGLSLPGNDTWYWFMIVAQAGGKFINSDVTGLGCIDDGTMETGFKYYQNLKNKNLMYFGPVTDSNVTCRQMFLDGKAAMYISSTGNLGAIKASVPTFNWQVAFVPKGKEQVIPTGGCSVVIMEASKNKDAAWEFLNWYVTDPKGGVNFAINTGYIPFTQSMTNSDAIKKLWAEDPNSKTAFEQLKYASDKGHRTPKTGDILNDIISTVEAVMYDNNDVKTQIDILAENVKETFAD